jgi:hypothetical protein
MVDMIIDVDVQAKYSLSLSLWYGGEMKGSGRLIGAQGWMGPPPRMQVNTTFQPFA